MKNLFAFITIFMSLSLQAQTIKSKILQLKYTTPAGWNAEEFGGKNNWDESGNTLCKCSGLHVTKPKNNGLLHVLVYPSTVNGLDSSKRDMVGNLRFVPVEKYDKTRNKHFSFEKRRSEFEDLKSKNKSFEVIRYKAKVDDHYYIFYTWQEKQGAIDPDTEKELFEVINAMEPL
jgi:hypothetical protein